MGTTIGAAQLVISDRLDRFIERHQIIEDVGDAENGPALQVYYDYPNWVNDTVCSSRDVPAELIAITNYEYFHTDQDECEWYEWVQAATEKIQNYLNRQ